MNNDSYEGIFNILSFFFRFGKRKWLPKKGARGQIKCRYIFKLPPILCDLWGRYEHRNMIKKTIIEKKLIKLEEIEINRMLKEKRKG